MSKRKPIHPVPLTMVALSIVGLAWSGSAPEVAIGLGIGLALTFAMWLKVRRKSAAVDDGHRSNRGGW